MDWTEIIIDSLKLSDTSLIAYVPDISIDRVTSKIDEAVSYTHLTLPTTPYV